MTDLHEGSAESCTTERGRTNMDEEEEHEEQVIDMSWASWLLIGDIVSERQRDFYKWLQPIKQGQVDVLRQSLFAGFHIMDIFGTKALLYATELNQAECLEVLLRAGADSNKMGVYGICITPLKLAAMRGYHRCLRKLLTLGADPNYLHTWRVKTYARFRTGNQDEKDKTRSQVYRYLRQDAFGDLHYYGSALVRAILKGDEESVVILIEAGAHVDPSDCLLSAPLEWAVLEGRVDCMNAILREINKRIGNASTPLSGRCGDELYTSSFDSSHLCDRLSCTLSIMDSKQRDEEWTTWERRGSLLEYTAHLGFIKCLNGLLAVETNQVTMTAALISAITGHKYMCAYVLANKLDVEQIFSFGLGESAWNEYFGECVPFVLNFIPWTLRIYLDLGLPVNLCREGDSLLSCLMRQYYRQQISEFAREIWLEEPMRLLLLYGADPDLGTLLPNALHGIRPPRKFISGPVCSLLECALALRDWKCVRMLCAAGASRLELKVLPGAMNGLESLLREPILLTDLCCHVIRRRISPDLGRPVPKKIEDLPLTRDLQAFLNLPKLSDCHNSQCLCR